MNRRELVLAIAEKAEVDRKTADAMLTAFTEAVTETVCTMDRVPLSSSSVSLSSWSFVPSTCSIGRNCWNVTTPDDGSTVIVSAV